MHLIGKKRMTRNSGSTLLLKGIERAHLTQDDGMLRYSRTTENTWELFGCFKKGWLHGIHQYVIENQLINTLLPHNNFNTPTETGVIALSEKQNSSFSLSQHTLIINYIQEFFFLC